ncbi:hypothetical protein A5633_08580 [Mycolicibacterium elephantis]|nr:hypothetical protein A5633_08580 [Mycolicibacterium elephantis]
MTIPPAWPEVDEDVLRNCGDSFSNASQAVTAQLEFARHERARLFGGIGIWSGRGATAAGSALDKRIVDLESLKGSLDASVKLFNDSASTVVKTKTQIINNVETANEILNWVRSHPELTDEAKNAAIQAGVSAVRAENETAVTAGAASISATLTRPGELQQAANEVQSFRHGEGGTSSTLPNHNDAPLAPTGFDNPLTPTNIGAYAPVISEPEVLTASAGFDAPEPFVPASSPVDVGVSDSPAVPAGIDNPPRPGSEISPPLTATALPSSRSLGSPALQGVLGSPTGPRIGPSASPLSGTTGPSVSAPSTPGTPSTANPAAAAANQAQISELQRSMVDAAAKTAAQTPIPPPQATPSSMGAAPAAQPLAAPPVPDAPTSTTTPTPPPAPTSPAGASVGVTAPAPVTPAPGSGAAPGGAVPLGPPPTPPPAAPATPATAGPSVAPAAAAAGSSTVGAPAPVPVSAARAQREAIAAATLRRPSATDPVQVAHRIAAALNVGINDIGFFWITGLAKDGTIVVANNYGLGYIPEGVNLPDPVKMASADESIPATIRGTWATYPILALHGWAQHHNTELRAVIATEDQFKGFDPGAPKIVLRPDDIPQSGEMKGRRRLQVIAADAATRLAAISGGGLSDVLPPAPTDTEAPQDQRAELWFEVFRPLLSNAPDRGQVQLAAFVSYAQHAQELALHDAHIATDEASQRAAIADWIYWQHLSILSADAIAASTSV